MVMTSTRTATRGKWLAAPSAVVVSAMTLAGCGLFGSSSKSASPAATLQKAIKETNEGNFDDAKKDFQKVLDKDPQNKYAHYDLGYIAQTQGSRADAEKEYRLALASDPAFARALYNLAILVTADGDTQGAITLYRKAVTADEKDARSHFNLGLLLRKTGKQAEGNSQIQIAVQLDPSLAASARAQGVPLK
jgi:Tfp pilus assembly protein PilF